MADESDYSDSDGDGCYHVEIDIGYIRDEKYSVIETSIIKDKDLRSTATPELDAGRRILEERLLSEAEVRFVHRNNHLLPKGIDVMVGQCSLERFLKHIRQRGVARKPEFYETEIPGEYHFFPAWNQAFNEKWKNVIFFECSALRAIVNVVEKPEMSEEPIRELD